MKFEFALKASTLAMPSLPMGIYQSYIRYCFTSRAKEVGHPVLLDSGF